MQLTAKNIINTNSAALVLWNASGWEPFFNVIIAAEKKMINCMIASVVLPSRRDEPPTPIHAVTGLEHIIKNQMSGTQAVKLGSLWDFLYELRSQNVSPKQRDNARYLFIAA